MDEIKIDLLDPLSFSGEEERPTTTFSEWMEEEEEDPIELPLQIPTPMQMMQSVQVEKQKFVYTSLIANEITEQICCMKQKGVLEMHWEVRLSSEKELQISIHHYDTAPDRFHIEIGASPEMQEMLQKNLSSLEAKLASSLTKMECHFKPISIATKKKRKKVVESHNVVYSPD